MKITNFIIISSTIVFFLINSLSRYTASYYITI